MTKYLLTQEQKEWAWKYVQENSIANRGDKTDGSKKQQYEGILGEVVFADMFGLKRPGKKGFDNGIDFTLLDVAIDVKTMGRDCDVRDYFTNNLFASQVEGENYKNDIYLFASINRTTSQLEFTGWVKKIDVLNRVTGIGYFEDGEERKRSNGTTFKVRGGLYEVPNKFLNKFGTPDGFLMDIGGLAHPSNF
jgi:hypothetical protein